MTLDEVRLERLKKMHVASFHAVSDTPEEDAWKKLETWAKSKGLFKKTTEARVFGRNTYPTKNPEPHGYEFLMTIEENVEAEGDVKIKEIPGGLYAVLRFTDLNNIGKAWEKLWTWIKESKHEHVGWKKGEHGWCTSYEEHLTWYERKPPEEWVFDLWVDLKK